MNPAKSPRKTEKKAPSGPGHTRDPVSSQEEEFYRAIVNASPDNITITDLTGTILMGSPASVAMFGLPDEKAADGKNILEFIVPQEQERARQGISLIGTCGHARGEYHGLRMDGTVFPFEVHVSLMRDRQGRPWRLVHVVRDMTLHLQHEDRLSRLLARSQNQQQLIAAVAASPHVAQGNIGELARMVTEQAASILGVERANVWVFDNTETRLTCIDLYTATPGTHTSGAVLLEQEFRDEFSALKKAKFINADDPLTDPRTAGYVEGYLKPLRITSMLDAVIRSGGKNIGVICFEHVDTVHVWEPDEITFACQLADQIALAATNREWIRSQAALLESEEVFREVFNKANDAVFLHELTPEGPGKYLLVNDVALSWLGYTREELLSMSPRDIVPADIGRGLVPVIMGVLAEAGHATFESVHRRKDGSTYPVEVSTHVFPLGKRMVALSIARDITRRKQEQDALKKSEGRYRRLIEAVTDYVFTVRIENGHPVETVHGAGCEAVTGYTTRDFSGDPGLWLRMVVKEDRPAVLKQAEAILAGQDPRAIEHRIVHKDGQIRWVINTPVPHFDAAGNLLSYDGMIQDITERKVVELAFAKSEAQLNAILQASPIPKFVIDSNHRVISWNRALENTTGIKAEEVLGKDVHWKAFYPNKRACLADLLLDGTPELIVKIYPGKYRKSVVIDGAYEVTDFFPHMGTSGKWLHFIASLITDRNGMVIGAVETLEDITTLVQAQENLSKSEERFRQVADSTGVWIWEVDAEGLYIYSNSVIERILGYTPDEIVGKKYFYDFFAPRVREGLTKVALAAFGQKAEIRQFINPNLHQNGTEVILETNGSPVIDAMGNLTGYRGTDLDITDRMLAEQELKESEERYSALFSDSNSVSLLIDPDTGRIVDANDAAIRYYGYPRGVLLAKGIYDLNRLPRDRVVQNLVRAKDETAKHFQSVHYRADGEKRYVEIYSGPIRVHGKSLFYSIIHDITDRMLAEQELKESEERYSALFSDSNSVSLLIDPDTGRIVDANDAAIRYYRYPRSVLLAKGIYDLNRLPRDRVVQNLVRAKDETAKHFQSVHYRADGEKRYVEIYSGPIRVHGKSLFYSIIHDITESRLAARALQESEERYRTLIDQLPDYVIVHRGGILLYVNPAAASNIGYSAETLVGSRMMDFVAPESHEVLLRAVNRRMEGMEVPPYEIRIIAGDGTLRTVLVNGALVQYQGSPASLNVLTDITSLKEAEQAIRVANEELEQRVADRTKDLENANVQLRAEVKARNRAEQEIRKSLDEKVLLLREIHHRVKNNLQIIASLLKLQSRYITDKNVLEAIRESQSRVRAMALVHERIYRSPTLSEINLREYFNYLTRQIFQFYNIEQHRIGISVVMEDISTDIDTVIPVGLIMNELVSNSLKHAFPDGRRGTIAIESTRVPDSAFRCVYHDDGAGFPPGFDWRNTESLGLRLVNNLVDQLNGTIEKEDGPGTTFVITIPLKRGG